MRFAQGFVAPVVRHLEALPHHLTQNANFGKDWALALKEAFLAAQKDLEDFCKSMNVNIEVPHQTPAPSRPPE